MEGRRDKLWAGALAAVFALSLVTTGCSSSSSKSSSSSAGAAADRAAPAAQPAADAKAGAPGSGGLMQEAAAPKAASNAASTAAGAKPADPGKLPSALQAPAGFVRSDAQDALNRKLIYKANLTMEVADYAKAQTDIRDLVQLKGAYILQFTENQTSGEQSGNFVIKVPAGGFSSLLGDLDKMETVKTQRNFQGQDVSEEYVDLESRLKAKQAAEARLLAFMEKATKTDDLVAFSNEIGKVQQEIEQIKGRMRYLDQNVALSTIEIRLYQKAGLASTKKGMAGAVSVKSQIYDALASSLRVMGVVAAKLVIFAAGALPVLIVLAVIVIPAIYVNKKRRKREAVLPKLGE